MNPKVAKAAALAAFDAADYTWIDLTSSNEPPAEVLAKVPELSEYPIGKMPLLFERMAVMPKTMYGEVVVTIERTGEVLKVSLWPQGDARSAFHAQLEDDPTDAGQFLIGLEIEQQVLEDLARSLGSKDAAQARVQENIVRILVDVYFATVGGDVVETYSCSPNPTNSKRKRKGKLPLYEWKTIVIDPSRTKRLREEVKAYKERGNYREHEVRGHWAMRKKSGKRYWVRAHKRGDPSKGTVFHDYQTKSGASK